MKRTNSIRRENNDAALFYAGYEVNNNNPDRIKFSNKPVFQIALSTLCSKEESRISVSSLHNGLLTLRHTKAYQPVEKYEFNRYYYLCLFEERFLPEIFRENLKQLHLFTKGETKELILSGSAFGAASQLFIKVIAEQHCDYPHKYDLIRIYITQLVHLAMKTDVVE
ncbi:hypothetical protein [Chitinophaga sp. CF418]|uniref:hypothetical protein n=1 Tax=Chitinophaga sp. CF418 TaxID=1855287 RepID=UPI00122C4C60|nr:hypothetical protein [Chitinophaga sp. CF418]